MLSESSKRSHAKTHLPALLDRVARGERITIKRHGASAAMLVPVGESDRKLTHEEIGEACEHYASG